MTYKDEAKCERRNPEDPTFVDPYIYGPYNYKTDGERLEDKKNPRETIRHW